MTNTPEEYRAKADHCRQMADQAMSPLDKEMWLQLAAVHERLNSGQTESGAEH